MRVIVTIFILAGLTNAARAGCDGPVVGDPPAGRVEQPSSAGWSRAAPDPGAGRRSHPAVTAGPRLAAGDG